jgi:hypothetical protein
MSKTGIAAIIRAARTLAIFRNPSLLAQARAH